MDQPILIDTKMHGMEGITGCFVVKGSERTALVETGPKSSLEHVLKGLEDAGVDALDWIVVTHIHLDHAGAAGTLAARFPTARVAVHEVGAPHLADPSKLWSSAARIYGERMDELWGGIDPIDPERITALTGGDEIDLGGRKLTAHDTPGHARHHHTYVDDATGIAFTGDAMGVRLADVGVVRPATPPPEFDLEDAIASIEKIRALGASELWLTHFGSQKPQSQDEVCDEAVTALRSWAEWVKDARASTEDLDEIAAQVQKRAEEDLGGRLTPDAIDRMEQTTSYWMNTWGYVRYLDRKAKAG
ncbi:MAG: MBL fold metallo-hydrolase [Actinobacteria bacterium]|nr:MBL fold metallo-hydrolase [Actinomycetota bacterium]